MFAGQTRFLGPDILPVICSQAIETADVDASEAAEYYFACRRQTER